MPLHKKPKPFQSRPNGAADDCMLNQVLPWVLHHGPLSPALLWLTSALELLLDHIDSLVDGCRIEHNTSIFTRSTTKALPSLFAVHSWVIMRVRLDYVS
jgi:hypothetical protein